MTRPLQVYMEEKELERLEVWSRARGWTKSQAIRAAVRAMTREGKTDPLLSASGMIHGLPADLSTNFDRHLEETFVVTASPSRTKVKKPPRARLRR
jgi:hypothetical protein